MRDEFSIVSARTKGDFSEAKLLFLEYANELGVDLCFQGFDKELEEIGIQYSAPSGILLLLKRGTNSVGCVGLRRIIEGVSEMKRMYIRKEFRGVGRSKDLIGQLLSAAKGMNYRSVRLDTLPQMKEAIGLYLSFGFRETAPYRFNPVEGAKFMELELG